MFDAHDRAFSFFKGACTRGIYVSLFVLSLRCLRTRMKTAVDTVFLGKKRRLVWPRSGKHRGQTRRRDACLIAAIKHKCVSYCPRHTSILNGRIRPSGRCSRR